MNYITTPSHTYIKSAKHIQLRVLVWLVCERGLIIRNIWMDFMVYARVNAVQNNLSIFATIRSRNKQSHANTNTPTDLWLALLLRSISSNWLTYRVPIIHRILRLNAFIAPIDRTIDDGRCSVQLHSWLTNKIDVRQRTRNKMLHSLWVRNEQLKT